MIKNIQIGPHYLIRLGVSNVREIRILKESEKCFLVKFYNPSHSEWVFKYHVEAYELVEILEPRLYRTEKIKELLNEDNK